jgi:Kef-type K+ transport system membrane component KefB
VETLLKISIVLIAGLIGGRVAGLLKLPNVTGYLVAGVLVGPSFLHVITAQDSVSLAIISDVALAIIAFSIGSEFLLKEIRKLGKKIFIITVAEVLGAVILVFVVMFFIFKQPFAFSIVIASMSATTAPAATMMVIKQYQANGPLTRTVLPVVALDDIVGIMVFGIAMSLAQLSIGNNQTSLTTMISQPIIEIVGSCLLGLVLGFILTYFVRKARDNEDLMMMALAAIGLATGLASWMGLSPLLACIMLGATMVNLTPTAHRTFNALNNFAPPVYLLFFTLAGASLDLNILKQVGLIGIAYIFARGAGKIFGAWTGTTMVNAEQQVAQNLGLALLAQGGVSIGLSILVRQQLPQYSAAITTIIMFSVLIYEISGPILAKIALQRAGEITLREVSTE